ncbi:FHA domain-containing protein [Nocardioides sp. QY071]|uniref:FHA domain-containing protein n=1 Tax=Nocardioides sp. QY071 TaxID=3044187 RepID=UPI00249A5920|nr:FHA domain-containing protein [Nocardioides sp. QY071]WGY00542.1 FHA domain-containing protein [Nocardioides sp. QY071]
MTHSSADDWTAASVVPGPGGGTLARFGPVVLLVGSDDPEVVRPYLEHAEMVAANGGQGRQLIRGFALMLSTSVDQSPGFAAIAPHTTGLAVFVDGDVVVNVDGEEISGAQSLAWVERLIPWPVESVSAVLPGAAAPAAGSSYRLDGGVVPAGGFLVPTVGGTPAEPVLRPATQVRAPEPAPVVQAPPAVEPEPPVMAPVAGRPLPPAQPDEHVSFQSVLMSEVDDDIDDFEPLPIVEDAAQVHDDHAHEQVRGVYCKNQHFNDPRVLFCGICGINMVQQTPVLVNGPRPPLGVIVLDDGAVFQLDNPYLLGRDPAPDERIVAGEFRPLPIIDQSNQVSRVHARLELRGWDVVLVDNNSTNGTYVHLPKTPDWVRMPPGSEQVLVQGTRVRIGHRTLAFNTHAGNATG